MKKVIIVRSGSISEGARILNEEKKMLKIRNESTDIFDILNKRRSIRKFDENKSISNETLTKLLEAGIRAPFASQLYSIIYTSNKDKLKKIKGIYSSTQVLMLFFVDFRKIEKIIHFLGKKYDYDDGMLLWLALQDAALVIENIILLAEAEGLGSVLIGGIPLQADRIIDIFKIPKRVFPIIALCLGYPYPSKETDIRPRYPLKYIAFKDEFHDLTEDEIQECMNTMDEGFLTQDYYIKLQAKIPLIKGKEDKIDYDKYSWSEHQSRKYTQGRLTEKPLFSIIKKHGFKID